MTYTQRRADGWPLCPRCGDDELWSPTSDEAGIRGCLSCGWTIDAYKRWLDAEATAAVARYKHLDAALAVFLTDHGNSFHRLLLEDPGNPGQVGIFGEVLAPPGFRLETDAELRERIKTELNQEEL